MASKDALTRAEAQHYTEPSEWDTGTAKSDTGKLFDVTCVIGSVRSDTDRDYAQTPGEAALLLIARHDAEGHYTFPMQSGGTMHVTIEHELPPQQVEQY